MICLEFGLMRMMKRWMADELGSDIADEDSSYIDRLDKETVLSTAENYVGIVFL